MAVSQRQEFRSSPFTKFALQTQVFLLRRNWMGKMGDFVMVITTTGRKTGRPYSTPIGYLQDGESYLALSRNEQANLGVSNWWRNLKAKPEATIEVKGRKIQVRAGFVIDEAERRQILELYRQKLPDVFPRLFRLPADAPEAELQKSLAERAFVWLHPIKR